MSLPRAGIILAAGRGRRLSPLTDAIPKPLLRYDGRTFLERALLEFERAGVQEVIIVTGYLGHMIKSNIRKSAYKFRIEFADQTQLTGSAAALGVAISSLDISSYASIAIVASDYVFPNGTIAELFDEHEHLGVDGTVLTTIARNQKASKSSVVSRGEQLITRIDEKPNWIEEGVDYEVCKLCYVFSSNLMKYMRIAQNTQGREESIPDRINFAIGKQSRFSSLSVEALPDAEEVLAR